MVIPAPEFTLTCLVGAKAAADGTANHGATAAHADLH